MKPSPSTLPSSNLFVATVVPWLTAVIASPPASTRCFVGWTPARKPSAGSDGVDGVLVVTTSPVPTSTATTSVKVPPVSIPILTRRLTWPIPPPGPVPGVGESCQVPFARAGWCGAMRREPRGAGGAPAHAPRVHRPGGSRRRPAAGRRLALPRLGPRRAGRVHRGPARVLGGAGGGRRPPGRETVAVGGRGAGGGVPDVAGAAVVRGRDPRLDGVRSGEQLDRAPRARGAIELLT